MTKNIYSDIRFSFLSWALDKRDIRYIRSPQKKMWIHRFRAHGPRSHGRDTWGATEWELREEKIVSSFNSICLFLISNHIIKIVYLNRNINIFSSQIAVGDILGSEKWVNRSKEHKLGSISVPFLCFPERSRFYERSLIFNTRLTVKVNRLLISRLKMCQH